MLSLLLTLVMAAPTPLESAGSFQPPAVLVNPRAAARRVAACGFKSVRPRFDDELQEAVVEVRKAGFASAKQLRCTAAASLDTHYYVIFPPPMYRAYERLYWRMSNERDKADARAWLDKRGLLSRLPTYEPKHSDEAVFAQRLEALCGPRAAGTLQPMHGMATFKKDALGTMEKDRFTEGKLDDETMRCLVNAAAASDFPLGFIGNEAYQQRP
jgi:hypothetical protein